MNPVVENDITVFLHSGLGYMRSMFNKVTHTDNTTHCLKETMSFFTTG